MTRLGYLVKNPKRTLGALGTLMVAAGLTVGSGAYFTDTESSTLNSATAAEFDLRMAGSSSPVIDAAKCHQGATPDCVVTGLTAFNDVAKTTFQIDKLVPSDTRTYTRRLAIRNAGNVDQRYRLKALVDGTSDADFLNAVKVDVTEVGAASPGILDDGSLDDLNTTGRIDEGETKTFEVTFSFPDDDTDQTPALAENAFTATIKAVANDLNKGNPADFTS